MIIGITSIKIGYVSSIFGGIIDLKTHSLELFGMEVFIIPLVFTVIWYVFVFNALNWTDGIQGNTTSLSIISFFVIFLLGLKLYITDDHSALRNNAEFIMQITLILVGILIPFWFFDIKEKLLM
jgi:UDP-N-acetylmuramyl pentapeptide phosphotransferase/UDP-N-acetylglucosamine-1-phosphate transferase